VQKKLHTQNLEFRHKNYSCIHKNKKDFLGEIITKYLMQKQEAPIYLKAITIRDSSDIHTINEDIKKGMVLILRVTPLAQKDVKKLRKMVEELYVIARDSNADIARLGEERIIVTPPNVKIWKPDYDLK